MLALESNSQNFPIFRKLQMITRLEYCLTMKNTTLIILITLLGASLSAQNLVPNGSFEEGIECPSFIGNVTAQCSDWYGSILSDNENDPTPEWFHDCSELEAFTPPDVAFGFQFPQEGLGYAGLVSYISVDNNYRETIGVELNEPLQEGNTYLVEFFVSNISLVETGFGVNNFGFNFTTYSHYIESSFPINESHFSIDSIISIGSSWIFVSEQFESDSAYTHLHIGNFFDADNIIIDSNGLNVGLGYFGVDNVSVTETLSLKNQSNLKSSVVIYPNPTSNSLTIELPANEILTELSIYSTEGQLVSNQSELYVKNKMNLDISDLPTGMYFVLAESNKSIYRELLIKK
jgi:hypothetical protein